MTIHDLTTIRGAGGGGGKKGGGSSSNAPNSLRSKARARMVEVISEGPIVGLVDGEKSIYFDQTALLNSDGTYNFDNVIWDQSLGSADGKAFKGQSGTETPTEVNVVVKQATGPVQRTIVDKNVDAVRVIVQVDSLYKVDKKSGRLKVNDLSYSIMVRGNAGAWQEAVKNELKGEKNTAPTQFAHRVELPEGGSPWDLAVRKNTADSDDDNDQKNMTFQGYVELVEGKFTYPFCAAVAMEVNAEDMGNSIPARSYHVRGLKVKVPNNYDPETRTYTGLWNGGMKTAWTNNPAWIFYDLLINDRYGLGEFVDAAIVDKASLYTIAQYCDQEVKSGFKNADTGADIMEPRFTYNGVIKSRDDAFFVLQTMTTAWRGMAYWSLGQVFATADIPADPIRLVTPANVIGGEFNYSSTATKARHSVILVKWNDPDDFYRSSTEVVIDSEALQRYGWREKTVSLNGCTSRGLAHRYGKWVLDVEQNETETVEYASSWDHLEVRPGDIVAIANPRKAGVRMGGRLVSHSGNTITLDYDLDTSASATYQIMLTMPDGSVETKDITQVISARQVRASGFSATALANSVYIVKGSDVVPRQYRVLSLAESEENIYTVTALFHDPLKYDRIEKDIVFDPLPYSKPSRTSKPPTNLKVTETGYTLNGATYTRLTLSWTPPIGIVSRSYVVTVDTPYDKGVTIGTTAMNTIEFESAGAGDYTFYVQTIDYAGSISKSAVLSFTAEGPGKYVLPVVSNLELSDNPGSTTFNGRDVRLRWTNLFPSSTAAGADGSTPTDEGSPLYSFNSVNVYRVDDGVLLRTERVTGHAYTYSFLANRNDNRANEADNAARRLRFVVTATDVYGRESNPVELTVQNPVPAMFVPTAYANGSQIFMNWRNPVDDTDIEGTMIWASKTTGFDPYTTTPIFDGTGSYAVYPGEVSTTYYIRAAAYDAFGKIDLNICPEIEVTTMADIDFEAPDIPTGLVLTSELTGDARVKLIATWNANTETDLAYYDIRLREEESNYVGFTTSENRAEWTINPGVTVTASLRAVDALGNKSGYSEEVVHVTARDTTPPVAPTGLTASAGVDAVWLRWTPNVETDLAYYDVFEGATNDVTLAAMIGRVAGTSVSRAGMPLATTRYYWVRAVDTSGNEGEFSASISATTGALPDAMVLALEGVLFSPNYTVVNRLGWSAGKVSYGAPGSIPVEIDLAAGEADWTVGSLYIFYIQGEAILRATTLIVEAFQTGANLIGIYKGGADFQATEGKALIDGNSIVAGTIGANQLVTNAAVITGAAQIKSAIIGDAHITELSAAKLKAETAIVGSVTVGGNPLSTIGTNAMNPAARINAASTQIDPGKILISGSTSLASWRDGADQTKIDGGALSANSVATNTLKVGARGVTIRGCDFQVNKTTREISWTAGVIGWIGDDGAATDVTITAGSYTPPSTAGYIYWDKGATTLTGTNLIRSATGDDKVQLAAWNNAASLQVMYGGTIIDGTRIVTGTITADQMGANSISAVQLQANAIQAEHVGASVINAKHMVLQDGTNLIQNGDFSDVTGDTINALWTFNGGSYRADAVSTGVPFFWPYQAGAQTNQNQLVLDQITAATSVSMYMTSKEMIPVTGGEILSWELQARTNTTAATAGLYVRFMWFDAAGAAVNGTSTGYSDAISNGPVPSQFGTPFSGKMTVPAAARFFRMRIYNHTTNTLARYVILDRVSVRRANAASLIVDGTLKASMIDVDQLSAISANLGAVTAGSMNINNQFIVSSAGAVTIRNATTGQRLLITNSLVRVYDANNIERVRLGIW